MQIRFNDGKTMCACTSTCMCQHRVQHYSASKNTPLQQVGTATVLNNQMIRFCYHCEKQNLCLTGSASCSLLSWSPIPVTDLSTQSKHKQSLHCLLLLLSALKSSTFWRTRPTATGVMFHVIPVKNSLTIFSYDLRGICHFVHWGNCGDLCQ